MCSIAKNENFNFWHFYSSSSFFSFHFEDFTLNFIFGVTNINFFWKFEWGWSRQIEKNQRATVFNTCNQSLPSSVLCKLKILIFWTHFFSCYWKFGFSFLKKYESYEFYSKSSWKFVDEFKIYEILMFCPFRWHRNMKFEIFVTAHII